MKTLSLKYPLLIISIALTSLVIVSCDKDDDDVNDNRMFNISGNATGALEVPAVNTAGTGTLTGTYNADNNQLQYHIMWTGLTGTVSAMHIHGPALAGVNANVIHPLDITTNGASGMSQGTLTLADSTENHLMNGRLYYNIHTPLHPNGEIRSQLSATAQ